MADNVVFLEPGDERAQKIAKAMGSQTASDILQLLSDGQKSLTDITERLAIPMTTAKYHVENLLDAGLISVAETKYSVKGREVKLYSLTNQLLIVAPRHSNVRSLLLKYASLFGIVAFGSVVIAVVSSFLGSQQVMQNSLNAVPRMSVVQESGGSYAKAIADGYTANVTMTPSALMTAPTGLSETQVANISSLPPEAMIPFNQLSPGGAPSLFPPMPDTALAFLLGGVLVIFVLICYEAYIWKKQ